MLVHLSTGRATGSTNEFRVVSARKSHDCRTTLTRMSGIEPVAGATHGDEVARLLGVGFEALAQLADEVVDRAHRARGLAPHGAEQLRAREHLVRVAQEEHEQLELEVRQLDLAAVARDEAL